MYYRFSSGDINSFRQLARKGVCKVKRNKKAKDILLGTVCAIFGIGLIIHGLQILLNQAALRENGLETTAVVTERTYGGPRGSSRIFVQYTIDGVEHRNQLHILVAGTYVGEEISIYYCPDNPNNIIPADRGRTSNNRRAVLLFIMGALTVFIGMAMFIEPPGRRNNRKEKHRKETDKLSGRRKNAKKRVVCPIPVILKMIQDMVDSGTGMCELVILFENEKHEVGVSSDYEDSRGFFDSIFFLDEQKFDTFEKFKSGAVLRGRLFSHRTDEVEVIEADRGLTKFPWNTVLEKYVVD